MMASAGLSRATRDWSILLVWTCFAALATVVLLAPGVYNEGYTHDIFVVLENGSRAFAGQVPHLDYHTPVGLAYAWPWDVLKWVEPYTIRTMLHANLLVAGALLVFATFTLPRRLGPWLFVALCLAIMATAISPRGLDGSLLKITHLAPYNRWSQAAVMLLLPLVLLAPGDGAGRVTAPVRDTTGGVVLGLVLAFMAFLKITYFLLFGLPLVTGFLLAQVRWRTLVVAGVAFAMVALAVQATSGNIGAYLADLKMAAAATAEVYGKPRPLNGKVGAAYSLLYFAGLAVLYALSAPWHGARAHYLRWRKPTVLVVVTIVTAALMNTQNHTQFEIPVMGVAMIVAMELIQRETSQLAPAGWRRLATVALVVTGALATPALDLTGVVAHTLRGRSACTIPGWQGTPGAELLLPRRAFYATSRETAASCPPLATLDRATMPRTNSLEIEAARMVEARQLLEQHIPPKAVILDLDFSNPFPSFTGTVPPRGALIWWDPGRDFSAHHHPEGSVMLRDADYVFQSTYDAPGFTNAAMLTAIYQTDVARNFKLVGQSSMFRLWQRRSAR